MDLYSQTFARNLGIITEAEQERLRRSRIAIAGMGGVGGYHLTTLARMGIGKFRIADADRFELANINRQYGATRESLGRKKVDVMREIALSINPEIEIETFPALSLENIARFLDDADLAIDGIDFFAVDDKRLLFRESRSRSVPVITAGPLGFGAILIVFSPQGMLFDEYFGLSDALEADEKIAAFASGIAPKGLHLSYMDLSRVDLKAGTGPALASACALCAAMAGAESLNILLDKSPIWPAPYYFQFDPFRKIFKKGYLFLGGRNPLQRLKRRILLKRLRGTAA
ncbi:MAG: ThiF family adenylyltransferase [Elusimicrobia bacterium]|nr:ThiF family adenylyltransferase [Elusimicrobiota bacterium]